MKLNHQKTESNQSDSSTNKAKSERKKIAPLDETTIDTISKHMNRALQGAAVTGTDTPEEAGRQKNEADRNRATTEDHGATSSIYDPRKLPKNHVSGEDHYKKIAGTSLYYLESGPGLHQMNATLNLATHKKSRGNGNSLMGSSLVYDGLRNAYETKDLVESQKALIASTMKVLKENTAHTAVFDNWTKSEEEAVKIISKNSEYSPQLINSGYKGHSISAALYKKELYIGNRGSLAIGADLLRKDPENEKIYADILSAHPTVKLKNENEVEDLLSKLIRAKKLSLKEASPLWGEIYKKFDDAAKQQKQGEQNSMATSSTSDIWSDQGEARGEPIRIKTQAGANCSYTSPQLATRAIMNMLGKESGLSPGLIYDTYKKSISNSSMRERYLTHYLEYKIANEPGYNYKEDGFLNFERKDGEHSAHYWYNKRVDKRTETIRKIQEDITNAANHRAQTTTPNTTTDQTPSGSGDKIQSKSPSPETNGESLIEAPKTNPATQQQSAISPTDQSKALPEVFDSTAANAEKPLTSTPAQVKLPNNLTDEIEEEDYDETRATGTQDDGFGYKTDATDNNIKNSLQELTYHDEASSIQNDGPPRSASGVENHPQAAPGATRKIIDRDKSGNVRETTFRIEDGFKTQVIIWDGRNPDVMKQKATYNPDGSSTVTDYLNNGSEIEEKYNADGLISSSTAKGSGGNTISSTEYYHENGIHVVTETDPSGKIRETTFLTNSGKNLQMTILDSHDSSVIISRTFYGADETSTIYDYSNKNFEIKTEYDSNGSALNSTTNIDGRAGFSVSRNGIISGIDWAQDIDPLLLEAFSSTTELFRPANLEVDVFFNSAEVRAQALMSFDDQRAALGMPFEAISNLNVNTPENFQNVKIDYSHHQWKENLKSLPSEYFIDGSKQKFIENLDALARGEGADNAQWQMTGLGSNLKTIDNLTTLGTFNDMYQTGKGAIRSARLATKCLYGLGFIASAAGFGYGVAKAVQWFTDTEKDDLSEYYIGVQAAENPEKAYMALAAVGGPAAGIAASIDARSKGCTFAECAKAFFSGCIGLYDPLDPDGAKRDDPPVSSSSIGLGCWVAREVYGENNPRWLAFREWLVNEAPPWFRKLYFKYGPQFADFIKGKPRLKAKIKAWMETKIDSRVDISAQKYTILMDRYKHLESIKIVSCKHSTT